MRNAAFLRRELVELLRAKGIADERVLEAIGTVPRHVFIPDSSLQHRAYEDEAIPIRRGQTISQPFTVAYMTALLDAQPGERILEVGTGSGYQAAVLVALGARVFSVERHKPLLDQTRGVLAEHGISVRTRHGDGMEGWRAYAPYDAIIVTAAGPDVPPDLVEQLRAPTETKPGGRLVIPIGEHDGQQQIYRIRRTGADEIETEPLAKVRFVPLLPGTPGA
ncbi:protein-L-isoaspartate(D-aspartate) O-methyltransferase [Rubricoccus marinus]|uniref:Protein-L-isoaspartate O-methyltransferase n=1 Tax=Rubricoccus marinus TaxID=716817 RepID=A0A259TUZ2_9BACT|nr:protein-L-isoaspartate(D-aspartate) O-methyltransferase [Rubricoccus marinus]OZC01516.1 protein-L-isoaspartate O-methyltransferase [Rubricoccus marinus]